MKRIHPLIQAAVFGSSIAFSMTAFAAGEYSSSGSTGASGSSSSTYGSPGAADSAEREQRRGAGPGPGMNEPDDPQKNPAASGTTRGSRSTSGSTGATGGTYPSGSTGATGARSSSQRAADSAEQEQRRGAGPGPGMHEPVDPQKNPAAVQPR